MPTNPNRLSQFWQELKRRKVVRVITVYAAAAFVILELVSIIVEPLKLPEWTLPMIIVLLCVGFIIAVILSWIYDIHPEGGIVKTEPAHKAKKEEKPVSSKGWKIASYVSFVVIVGLVVFHIVSTSNRFKEIAILDKSIAVLPFISLSDDPEKQYLADGVMDAILLNLSKIEDLRVMSRTSVEQYRKTEKTVNEICQELDVAFVLEGSFQKYGDQAKLTVQLIIPGKEEHIWANDYDRHWKDIFSVQSEVAQKIAGELKAVITPEEEELIEKIPTTNLTAYEFYQKGREEYIKYWVDFENLGALENAADLFHYALEYDSTYAQAYAGLAMTLQSMYVATNTYSQFYSDAYLQKQTFDSVLYLANLALSFDSQLAEAHVVKGNYFRETGERDRAEIEFNLAIALNPNSWEAYYGIGELYYMIDNLKSLIHYHQAASLHHGSELPIILKKIITVYFFVGLYEEAKFYNKEVTKLDGDSMTYYFYSYGIEACAGNFDKAGEFLNYAYAIDSTNLGVLSFMGTNYMLLGQHEESLVYFKKYFDQLKIFGGTSVNSMHQIGYAYWQEGHFEEADNYFDKQIETCKGLIKLGRPHAQNANAYYDLAAVYAFRGEKDKAYENLEIFNQKESMFSGIVTIIKNDPLFNSIRDEPEFQQIVRDIEAKYQAEHEKVRKWLEENDML